jgi:TPR repeat protein
MRVILFLSLLLPTFLWASTESCINQTAHVDYAKPDQGVPFSKINWQQAIPLCEKALKADRTNFKVSYGLGRAYSLKSKETGDLQDIEQSSHYYELSFEAGYADGAWATGKLYAKQKNWQQAEKWLTKGIESGSISAANFLAILFYDESYGYPKINFSRAISILKGVESKNDEFTLYNLGWLHYYKKYEHENFALAKKYFERSAAYGHDTAMYLLGQIYDYGYGVTKNPKKAVEYYQQAKKAGSTKKEIDERTIQNAWNLWLKDDDAYEYYDLAINTLRELAKKDNKNAIKFLYMQKVGISADVSPIDMAMVQMQAGVYIKRATKASEESKKELTKASVARARKAIKGYADLMIENGLYRDSIMFFEKTVDIRYGITGELGKYYLALIYTKLYRDFKQKEDAIKAATFANATADEKIITSIMHSLQILAEDDENFDLDEIIKKSAQKNKQLDVDTFLKSFDETLKGGASKRALFYVENKVIAINAQRKSDGVSMLHLAVWHDNLAVTKKLVESGAQINLKDAEGDTALGYAIYKKNINLITYLSSKGAKN